MAKKDGEGADRQALAKIGRRAGLSVTVVECGGGVVNGATPGAPDLHMAGRVTGPYGPRQDASNLYIEPWVEMKVLDGGRIPDNARTDRVPITTGLDHYNSYQRTWAVRHNHVGGRVYLFLRVTWPGEKRHYLYPGAWAAEHLGRTVRLSELGDYSLFERHHTEMPDHEQLIRAFLRNG